MSEVPVALTLDLKKYRLRIHKAMLHTLGDPQRVQLLVSPQRKVVAIRAVGHEMTGDQTHRVNMKAMRSDNSYEIYSRPFILKLQQVVGNLDDGATYRLRGSVYVSQGLAVFPLSTMKKVEID